MDVTLNNCANPHDEEGANRSTSREYETPLLTELGSLATLSQTDIFLSVGGGEG